MNRVVSSSLSTVVLTISSAVFMVAVAAQAPTKNASSPPRVSFKAGPFPTLSIKGANTHGARVTGATAFDVNGDGLSDLFIGRAEGLNDLLVVQDIKKHWIVSSLDDSSERTYAAVSADLNRDFKPDIVVSRQSGTFLFVNEGQGKFSKSKLGHHSVSEDTRVTMSIAVADVNGDGLADLFEARALTSGKDGKAKNRLWINQGGTKKQTPEFKEMAGPSGVTGCCNSYAALLLDLDNDLDQDIVVANHQGPIELFENDGRGKFTAGKISGVKDRGWTDIAAADFDNDGLVDLLVAAGSESGKADDHMKTDRKPYLLLRNTGDRKFKDVSANLFLKNNAASLSVSWADLDNDGLKDIVAIGRAQPENPGAGGLTILRQTRLCRFNEIDHPVGIELKFEGLSTLISDLNRDGHLDQVIVGRSGEVKVFYNKAKYNNWMGIRIRGRDDRTTLGSRVVLRLQDGTLMSRYHLAGGGLGIDHDDELIFGMGRRNSVTMMEIFWSSGKYTRVDNPLINRHIGFIEPSDKRGGRNIHLRNPLFDIAGMIKSNKSSTRQKNAC